jgi:hypothetical protein
LGCERGARGEADLIFSDEDIIEGTARRPDPWFKPDRNPALMLACNAFGRLGAPDMAEPCFTPLLQRTTYDDHEVLLLVNRSVSNVPERAALLKHIAEKERVRVIEHPECPFNYSAVNNFGAVQASGEFVFF